MKVNEALDEFDYLLTQVNSLSDSIDLAEQVSPDMLPELKRLQDQVVDRLHYIARFLLGPSRSSLAGKQKSLKVSLETLEIMFIKVQEATKIAYANASKAGGSKERRLNKISQALARLTQQAAEALRVVAEARGVWSEKYIEDQGLRVWLSATSEEE